MRASLWTFKYRHRLCRRRTFATVSPSILPYYKPPPSAPSLAVLDGRLLSALDAPERHTPLESVISQYVAHAGSSLGVALPYESQPTESRRSSMTKPHSGIVLVAHCARGGAETKITLCSGFTLEAQSPFDDETLVLTCAHTLEEMRRSSLLLPDPPASLGLPRATTGSFCVTHDAGNEIALHPVTGVVSALPKSDLLLLSCKIDRSKHKLNTLPVSPYPARAGAIIRGHFVALAEPPQQDGWRPWAGGTWSNWARGVVLGYRDFAGRDAEPGTYDALSHLLFSPPPTPGSSGGPIIEEESGAVVGVMLGSRMDSRVEGTRGWGVPSEMIYEMFTLPGLEGKK